MTTGRRYHYFVWKDAVYRICSSHVETIKSAIVAQRGILEDYIRERPDFRESLRPLPVPSDAPAIVMRMSCAAQITGVGPMAAVAGALGQIAVEKALAEGAREAIIDNGGDVYAAAPDSVLVGLLTGRPSVSGKLALRLPREDLPMAVCSSSSRMGHSLSLGDCDLVTVVSRDAALADAAATMACTRVTSEGVIEQVLEDTVALEGIRGVLIFRNDRIGMAGDLPPLIRI